MSIKTRILILIIVLIFLVVAAILCSNIMQFSNYVDTTMEDRVNSAANVAVNELEMLKTQASTASLYMAEDPAIVEALENGNLDMLLEVAEQLQRDSGVDFCTITDAAGIVQVRSHDAESFGDDLSMKDCISQALSGRNFAAFTESSDIAFSVRSGAPVFNSQGTIIGVVSAGFRLDNNAFVDSIKKLLGCEVTIFLGDERISTTVVKADGTRAIGTKADKSVSATVLAGNTYSGRAQILSRDALTKYSPIRGSDSKVVGMLFVGRYMSEKTDTVWSFVQFGLFITLFLLAISIPIVLIIVRRIVAPINIMVKASEKISQGEIDVEIPNNSKDETGKLAESFRTMVDAIKNLLTDITTLTEDAKEGHLQSRADASKHSGGYKKIVEGVNEMLDSVTAPVQVATGVLDEVSKGNLQVLVEGNYKGDHALIQNALNGTIQSLKGYIGEIKNILGAMAQGDLSVSILSNFHGDFTVLKESINTIAQSLNTMLRNINVAAEQVAMGTQHVADGAQDVSQGAIKQASSIEELTTMISHISTQIIQMANNSSIVNQKAIQMKEKAIKGNEQMKDMQHAMAAINEASTNISKVIKVIDDIAFQTNILALNAAVEAARAGVHGKGFAVVAEEVRNLATKSANAAKETANLIESSIEKTDTGKQIAENTLQSLQEIVTMVEDSVEALEQIAVSSKEQASGIELINKGIEQMSQVVQSNSATAEQSAASSQELSGQAEMLRGLVSDFKLLTD